MKTASTAAREVEILDYQPAYKDYFKSLNETWIEKYFRLEEEDQRILNHPETEILHRGGFIFFARLNGEIVGTCGLARNDDHSFELIKMGVAEQAQGRKIGYQLAQAAIGKAWEQGATKVVLYSETSLAPAIHLYRKLGFKEVPLACSHYERCNIQMELDLPANVIET